MPLKLSHKKAVDPACRKKTDCTTGTGCDPKEHGGVPDTEKEPHSIMDEPTKLLLPKKPKDEPTSTKGLC